MSHADAPAVDRCSVWDNTGCVGTEACQPRCPRFFDKHGEPLLVRPYRDEWFEDLLDMYGTFSSQTMGLPPKRRDATADWISALVRDGWNLVVLDGGDIVGHTAVTPVDDPAPELVVFVRDDYQDRGIGTELLRHVIAHAAARGHDALTLEVSAANRAAIAVYKRLGFEIVENRQQQYTMRLSLTDPIATQVQRPPAARSASAN